jgi:hypothetical protein
MVPFANAITDPVAVMVKVFHTFITDITMFARSLSDNFAIRTHILRFVLR